MGGGNEKIRKAHMNMALILWRLSTDLAKGFLLSSRFIDGRNRSSMCFQALRAAFDLIWN